MASLQLDSRKQLAVSLAQRAGELLLRADFETRTIRAKSSTTDIATDVDRDAERLIVEAIAVRFPDDGVYAEEGARSESASGFTWIVDPLDGTANFVRSLRMSAVSIAVAYNGVVVMGVVFDPYGSEMFVAVAGEGATCNGAVLDVLSKVPTLRESFVGLSGTNRPQPAQLRAALFGSLSLQADSVREIGSTALSLCFTAAGRFDAHIGVDVKWWDIAAGIVIAREAGCVVSGLLADTDPDPSGFIVANPSIQRELRAAIALG